MTAREFARAARIDTWSLVIILAGVAILDCYIWTHCP